MQRLLNNPENYVDEMLEGIYTAHPSQVTYVDNDLRCLVTTNKKPGKVGLATGGGSGHLPLFLGYVGKGLLDGCCVGGVFQSPSANQMLEITKSIDSGAGVLYIYGNYTGDILNFDMAQEMADFEGIEVRQILGADDVASAPKGLEEKRRGVAGIFYVYKVAGAAADSMLPLNEVERLAKKTAGLVKTMGVALTPCTIPEVGKPNFTIEDGMMEIGMGIHGEPGISRGPLETADEITTEIVNNLLKDTELTSGSEVSVLINGLGATPKEELYIIYRKVAEILKEKEITIFNNYIGEFATAMEMSGTSITILPLDEELKKYVAMPCSTPFFSQDQL